ncbi:hypothetical protein M9H77_36850 [Catharanthus roseus]|uniref:Uncharacterized protein n=1 Tax=Catharanthus roseus TaxID=4058 RepID=A0ACB9ZWR1_CATRO|nr:hypothetical protein M9H77_36850 [Catharanthus roseus]
MAPRSQTELVKIGMEGFSLIDEYFGRKNYNNKPQASSASATQRANYGNNFPANQHISHYRHYPQESYYRYHPQESQLVRISKVSSTETTVFKSNYESPFLMPNYN